MSFAPKQFNRSVDFLSTENSINTSTGCVNIYGGMSVSKDSYLTNVIVVGNTTIANLTISGNLKTSNGNTLISSQWTSTDSNTDVYFGTSANAFVGIGTTTPNFNLDISGGSRITGGLTVGNLNVNTGATIINLLNTTICTGTIILTTGTLNASFNSNTIGSLVTTGGNVGIGINTPETRLSISTNTGTIPLRLRSQAASTALTGIQFSLADTSVSTDSYVKGSIIYTVISTPGTARGNMFFCLNNASNSTNVSLSDARMTILDTGNVGIGTTAPTNTLDVSGSIRVGGGYNVISTQGAHLQWNRSGMDGETWLINQRGNGTNDSIRLASSSLSNVVTELWRFQSNNLYNMVGGNIFIDSPVGNSQFIFGFNTPKHTTQSEIIQVYNNSTDRTLAFRIGSKGTSSGIDYVNATVPFQATFNSNTIGNLYTTGGNIGIGITDPLRRLHVASNLRIGGSNAVLDLGDDVTTQIYRNGTTSEIRVNTDSIPRMTITSIGNIGIGTITPAYTLDVNGTGRFGISGNTGTVLINNRINTSGYMLNSNTAGNNVTTDVKVMNNRLRSSRSASNNAVSTWNTRALTASGFWPAICWSSDLSLFVVGSNSLMSSCQTSPDGINWTARTLGTSIQAWDVCWSSELSLFVMTQNAISTNPFQTSPDGIIWNTRTTVSAYSVTGICWSPELSIFVACAGASGVLVSSNGTSWTAYAISGSVSGNQRVCWSGELGIFVMTNRANGFFWSSNGTSWTSVSFTSISTMQAICWSPELGIFVAGGTVASTSTFATSPDGINWIVRTSPVTSIGHNNVIWSPELSIFVTSSGSYTFSSHDGITWTTRSSSLNTAYSICWSPELSIFAIVQAGNTNTVWTSNPGIPNSKNTLLVPASQLSINNLNGYIGINTTSPGESLDIRGNLRIGNSTQGNYIAFSGTNGDSPGTWTTTFIGERIYGGTENSELLLFKGNDSSSTSGPDRIRLLAAEHRFDIYTSALSGTFESIGATTVSNRMVIATTGNIGINTTNPDFTLDINGTSRVTGTLSATNNSNTLGNLYTTGGNIGINTTNPQAKLHINGNAGTNTIFEGTDHVFLQFYPYTFASGRKSWMGFGGANTTTFNITNEATGGNIDLVNSLGGSIRFINNTITAMTITGGNIGINTTTPQTKLHVEDGSVFIGDVSSGFSTSVPSAPGSNATANGHRLFFDNSHNGVLGTGIPANKIVLHNNAFTAGFGLEVGAVTYHSGNGHRFYGSADANNTYGNLAMSVFPTQTLVNTNTASEGGFRTVNSNAGSSAYGMLRIGNNIGDAVIFLNSSTRTLDGGPNTFTIRNDIGSLRLQGRNGLNTLFLPDNSANIGINTTSPTATLDVRGNGRFLSNNAFNSLIISNTVAAIDSLEMGIAHVTGELSVNARTGDSIIRSTKNLILQSGSGNSHMYIATSGNIGIGISTPSEKLHITGNLRIGNSTQSNYIMFSGTNGDQTGHTYIGERVYENPENSELLLFKGNDLGASGTDRIRLLSAEHRFDTYTNVLDGTFDVVGTTGSSNRMIILNNGNIGIGITNPVYKLHVAGDIYASGDVISFSDSRLKTDISTINNALDKVSDMRGVYYTNLNTQNRETGVIAQEMAEILPEVVADRGEYLGVAYGNIVGVLIEAIKELKARIVQLENR